jgi:AraC family transcriptional regulator, positive regulator of tynA and feaB
MPPVVEQGIKRWSTADVPTATRLDYFAAALSEATFPVGVDNADPLSFHAEVSAANLGTVSVCKAAGSPHGTFRGRSELARTDGHLFNLAMTLRSAWTAEHRGSLRMLPRDVLIFDSEYPLRTDVPNPFVAIHVIVSEAWLRRWIPNPHVLTARRIPGDSLWGLALASYLSELTPDLAAAPPLPLSVMADQVGSLIALTASGLREATLAGNTLAVRSLSDRILDCTTQRCTELELTAADVAKSLDISVRTLHRAFAATNATFGEKLIEARARVALRMLTSPLFNRVTTAEIGRRAGFLSASHFARVMRNQTGYTPLHFRRATGTKEPEAEDLN